MRKNSEVSKIRLVLLSITHRKTTVTHTVPRAQSTTWLNQPSFYRRYCPKGFMRLREAMMFPLKFSSHTGPA